MTTFCVLDSNGNVITTFANPQPDYPGFVAIPVDGGQVGQNWNGTTFTDPSDSVAQQKADLLAKLESQRLVVQTAGLPYNFSDGTSGVIQTRDVTEYPDLININGYTTTAMLCIQQGQTQMPSGFIDGNNIKHLMAPADAITMGLAVAAFIAKTYTSKSNLRDAINAMTSSAQVKAFDITKGW